jgi:hypothetical protein
MKPTGTVPTVLASILWLVLLLDPGNAQPSPGSPIFPADGSVTSLRGIKLPLGSKSALPSAYLWCREFTMGRRQWGIFRIGVIPEAMLSGVELHLRPGNQGENWAADLRDLLAQEPSLRGAKIKEFVIVNSSGQRLLQAATAAFAPKHDKVELREVRFGVPPGQPREHRQATLWLSGPVSGTLQLTTDDPELIRIEP